jgi:hypothetical protein
LSGCSFLRGIIPSLPNKGASASWTVMVYIGGDQEDIEESAWDSLDKMESVGSTDEVNIVVQLDPYQTCIGTYRYYVAGVEKGDGPPWYQTDIVEDLGEQDMTDPNVLTEFIGWAQENYPAEHYLLILSGHGGGCIIAPTKPAKGIITDCTTGSYEINIPDLVDSLEANDHIDILGFEACLMQMLEVAYEIGGAQDPPDYIVGSEGLASINATWSYNKFLEELTDNPEMYAKNPGKLCKIIVKSYSDIQYKSLSVLHGYKDTNNIKEVIDSFAIALIHSQYRSEIEEAKLDAKNYDSEYRIYKDLYDFAKKIRNDVPDCEIQAKRVIDLVKDLVYYRGYLGIFSLGSHGLSIYLPDTPENYRDSVYEDLQFAIDTKWDEFLKTHQTEYGVYDISATAVTYYPSTSGGIGYKNYIGWSTYSELLDLFDYQVYKKVGNEKIYNLVFDSKYNSYNSYGWHDFSWDDLNITEDETYSYFVTAYSNEWSTPPSQTVDIKIFLPSCSLISPKNDIVITDANPSFTWSPVGLLTSSSYMPYKPIVSGKTQVWVHDLTTDKRVWQIWFDGMTISNVIYNQDGKASPLVSGHSYAWSSWAWGYDLHGNSIAVSMGESWGFHYNIEVTYTINASAGSNGSISPSGDITVNQGSDKSFTISPDTGYQIADVLVDGILVGAVSSYTFTNVTEDHTISANFITGSQYPIQWSTAESNGWANPLGEGKELITNTAYDYDSPIYLYNWGKRHVGIDVHAQLDSNVF